MSKKTDSKLFFKYLFLIITAVQIVFAVIWLFLNIGGYREEYISGNYILAASSLVVDDYMGILYALVVRLLGHGVLLYVFQMLVVFAAALYIPVDGKLMHLALALNVVTNPFILQGECTVRPEALLMAGMITLVTSLIRGENVGVVVSVALMALLNPDYSIVLIIIIVPVLIFRFLKKKKYTLNLSIGFAVAIVLVLIINHGVTDVYAYGNVEKSFNFLCMQRFAGKEVTLSSDIIETCYNVNLYNEMRQAEKVPEKLGLVFASEFENYAGKESAEEVYKVIYKNALAKGPRHYIPGMAEDFLYYLLPPVATGYIWLNNITGTLISNPIRLFTRESYSLFLTYLMFGSFTAIVFMLSCLLLGIRRLCRKNAKKLVASLGLIIFSAVVLSAYGMFGCLRGFDYRNILFNVAVWPVLYTLFLCKKEVL